MGCPVLAAYKDLWSVDDMLRHKLKYKAGRKPSDGKEGLTDGQGAPLGPIGAKSATKPTAARLREADEEEEKAL